MEALTQLQNARVRALYQYSRANRLQTDARRFAAAEEAFGKGEIATAYRLYSRIAVARNTAPQTVTSRARVKEIQEQGQTELQALESQLETVIANLDAVRGQSSQRESAEQQLVQWESTLRDFCQNYGEVSKIENQIKVLLRRMQKEHGATLNEPEARRLLAHARTLEQSDETCCAFYVYERATELRPAPSAELAAERYHELLAHASIVSAAENCRKLQWCHTAYSEASELIEAQPETARGLLLKIVQRAPEDSTVCIAAREQLASLQ
jgi:hypothetical protein